VIALHGMLFRLLTAIFSVDISGKNPDSAHQLWMAATLPVENVLPCISQASHPLDCRSAATRKLDKYSPCKSGQPTGRERR
jgi:hypothetical protein